MKKHIFDKPILRHIFHGSIAFHKLCQNLIEIEEMNSEINSVLEDLKKKDPKVKIEKLRNALGNLVRINELHNEEVSKIIQNPVGWKDEYLDEARKALKETKP